MRIGVFHKVLLATSLSSFALIGLVMVFFFDSVDRGFSHYANSIELDKLSPSVERLGQAYAEHGSWEFLRGNRRRWQELLDPTPKPAGGPDPGRPEAVAPAPPAPPAPPPALHSDFGPPLAQRASRERSSDWLDDTPAASLAAHSAVQQQPATDNQDRLRDSAAAEPAAGRSDRRRDGGQRRPPPPAPPPPRENPLQLGERVTLYDFEQQPVMGHGSYQDELQFRPVRWQQRSVGWLAVRNITSGQNSLDSVFLDDIRTSLLKIGAIALLLSVLIAALLTHHILAPVRTLAAAVRRLTSGDFSGHPDSRRHDELGQLTRDFNILAQTLAANEESRKHWVSDISHELRTPLASLRAEVEALQDGVMTPDANTLNSLHGEVMRLGRLVNDLHQLACSDAGELQYLREVVDIAELLDQATAAIAHRFHDSAIALQVDCNGIAGSAVFGDPARLIQLFQNLLENSLRYTDQGGRTEIRCQHDGDRIVLRFSDSSPGIPDEDYERVFERLYRVDKSRARARGGSGLGLAICRQIIEAHQGSIAASPSTLGGVTMTITLPLDLT